MMGLGVRLRLIKRFLTHINWVVPDIEECVGNKKLHVVINKVRIRMSSLATTVG